MVRDAIFWVHGGNRAIRVGDWKLVAKGENGSWELYDVSKDRGEQHNLAAAHPDRVQSLSEQWTTWAAANNVLPVGTWHGRGKTR